MFPIKAARRWLLQLWEQKIHKIFPVSLECGARLSFGRWQQAIQTHESMLPCHEGTKGLNMADVYGAAQQNASAFRQFLVDVGHPTFNKTTTKLRGFSPQATAACRRNQCQLLRRDSVAWSAQRIPTAADLKFLDPDCYFSIQVAPRLSSRGKVGPVPVPLLLRKSGSAGNRTRDLWICSQKLWPLDHRGGSFVVCVLSNNQNVAKEK
jgi:hypothetical protein